MQRKVEATFRVLLVEHDAPFRRSLETFLRRVEYVFESCATAREAMTLMREQPYAVAVVESRLPDADGLDLVQRLRQQKPDLQAVLLSAYDDEAVTGGLQQNVDALFLKKPFDPTQLDVVLQAARNGSIERVRKLKWKYTFPMPDILTPVLE